MNCRLQLHRINIPSSIDVDVTNLQVAETITIADIGGRSIYQIKHDEDEVIGSILPPRQEEEINQVKHKVRHLLIMLKEEKQKGTNNK